ncbi:MAG: hypothetical protein P1P84_08810 [Deferrisomatales bacterium]|nr:hypothetical protein [Deferrisomatales bacterium]
MKDVLKAQEEKAFWGYEFLTWLWYRSEVEGGELEVPAMGPVSLWIEDRIVLGSLDTESKENILKDGDVSRSGEAAAALKLGKKLQQARFGMIREDREYRFVLDGTHLDWNSVKLPTTLAEEADDWHATALVRQSLIGECVDVFDALFQQFSQARISATWGGEVLPAMATWIAEKEGG